MENDEKVCRGKRQKCAGGNVTEYIGGCDIAEVFNAYFCSISDDLYTNLPHADMDPLNFMTGDNVSSFFLAPVSPRECSDIIVKLKKSKQSKNIIPVELFTVHH